MHASKAFLQVLERYLQWVGLSGCVPREKQPLREDIYTHSTTVPASGPSGQVRKNLTPFSEVVPRPKQIRSPRVPAYQQGTVAKGNKSPAQCSQTCSLLITVPSEDSASLHSNLHGQARSSSNTELTRWLCPFSEAPGFLDLEEGCGSFVLLFK